MYGRVIVRQSSDIFETLQKSIMAEILKIACLLLLWKAYATPDWHELVSDSKLGDGRTDDDNIKLVDEFVLSQRNTEGTRMWVSAQCDGRPAKYRWRPVFNAAKFGCRSLLDCHAVTRMPRRECRWNYLGCHKLPDRS